MEIDQIRLWNFRNYTEQNFKFDKKNLLLIGDNGQGKSNFLEAIYLMSFFRSFRTSQLKNCIKHGSEQFILNSKFKNGLNIAFQLNSKGKKKLKVNDEKLLRLSDAFGKVSIVAVSPEDLNILEGPPAGRRKFLDSVLSFLDKDYYKFLLEYNEFLKQRNESLKRGVCELLDIYDDKLIELNKLIYHKREEFIITLAKKVKYIYETLEFNADQIIVRYKSDVEKPDFEKEFKLRRNTDLILKKTGLGVHHDDFVVMIDNKKAIDISSQGQKRAISIAMKLAEYDFKKKSKQTNPIVLLDDTLLEFDKNRGKKMIDEILSESQIIATGTSEEFFKNRLNYDMEIVTVKSGEIIKA